MSNIYVGSKAFARKIDKAAEIYRSRAAFLRGDGLRPTLREMGEAMVKKYHDNISNFNPGKVADLRPGYKKEKLRDAGFLYPILLRTGQLIASFKVRVVHSGSKWTVYVNAYGPNISRNGRTVQNSQLAEWHRHGTTRMKARDFTFLGKRFEDKWKLNIRMAIRKGSRGG